ncbi:trypsin-like serine protease [Dokdonella soli]
MRHPLLSAALTSLCALLAMNAAPALARQGELPYSLAHRAKSSIVIPVEDVAAIDAVQQRAETDAAATIIGPHAKRLQVAIGNRVSISPDRSGVWQTLPDGSQLWRVQLRAVGATDLRLGFARFALPATATLYVIGADAYYQGPYTAADALNARFDAPVVPGDTATVEVRVPTNTWFSPRMLEVVNVGAGFRDLFGRSKAVSGPGTSGACNIDVVCPAGQPYPDEMRAVARYEYQADADRNHYYCTGTLLADVPRDRRNYFLTAAHCASTDSEAASMVVYWNYQSTQCGILSAPAAGFFNDDQHGATLRATRADVDFTLVELVQAPDPAWNVYRAGWDASNTVPVGTIGIHHPSGDVKKITVGPSPATTGNCIASTQTLASTHWRTGPYSLGTTESGSSGSGLFSVADSSPHARQLIGVLSGGDAACATSPPTSPNAGNDCYGKLAVAWDGASAVTRLRDWLDPANTGTKSLAGGDQLVPPPLPRLQHSTHVIPTILLQQSRRR